MAARRARPAALQPDTTSAAVDAMRARWELIETLRGGTVAMRKAGKKYLPADPNESTTAHDARVARSFLFNAYADTVEHLAARPFVRSVKLGEKSPAHFEAWSKDVDLEGSSLTDFAHAALETAIDYGLTHALVDFPTTGGRLSAAAEREQGVRPFFVHVPPAAVLGWRSARFRGAEVLTQLRFSETAIVADGAFGEKVVERVRVFDRFLPGESRTPAGRRRANDVGRTVWTLFERDGNTSAWRKVDEGDVSANEIPLRTLYTRRLAYMVGAPPLESLAWKNLEHWQSSSEQRHILHVARVPLLFGSGFEASDLIDPDTGQPVTLGPNRLLHAANPNAKLQFVEHTGEAIAAGRVDLQDLLEQMAALGMAPMIQRTGSVTATEKAIDQGEAVSDLKTWARRLESFLASLLDLGARWQNLEGEAAVDVFDDFGLALGGESGAQFLIEARKNGDLSREGFIREAVRRGLLAESFDVAVNEATLRVEEEEAAKRAAEIAKTQPQGGAPQPPNDPTGAAQ